MDFLNLLSICLPVLAFICVLIVVLLNFYIKLRPKCSVNVNCWFCNQWSKVAYELQNSWDCPFCEQYNGFTEDGDYNKPIPAQHDELMNKQVSSVLGASVTPDNGLCNSCNNNQQLKIHQLAMFSPIDESKFDEEIERYQKQLERAYRLCPQCEKTVKRTLHKQKSLLLGIRLSALRKQGLDYLDLNKSHPGISKTAKRKLFLTAIRYTSVALAVLRLLDILKSCDFSNENISNTLPGTVVPYALLGRDLLLLLQNVTLSLCECVQYFKSVLFDNFVSSVSDITQLYISICDLTYIQTTMSRLFIFTHNNSVNHTTILTSVGVFMQLVLLLFNSNFRKLDCVKCVVWVLLMWSGTGQLNNTYAQVSMSPKLVQIILCCFLITDPSSTQETKKIKKTSSRKIKTAANLENEFSDEEVQSEKDPDLLNSTFKSQCSNLNTSQNSSRSISPFNNSAATLKLFSLTGKKNENESLHVFGKQPVFDNPLNTSYFKFSPKFRSPGSLSESFSTKKSVVNESLNSSFYSDKLDDTLIFSASNSGEIRTELELNKGLNDLHLGTYPSTKKCNNTDIPPVFRVSSPVLTRPKNVLSPPRLGNVTQSSWVAGGYWKPSNEFTNNCGSFSNLSRSSSQSSGFGSQASNQQQQNFESATVFNSLPSSRNNSVCGEFDKYSVFSEPAYHYNAANKSMCNPNRVYPVFKPDQQIYICPKPVHPGGQQRVCSSPAQNHSVLNDTFWSTSSNSFAFPGINSNRPSSRESNLSQTNFNGSSSKCSTYNHNSTFNSQSPFNPFYSQPTIFAVNNTRPLPASYNRATCSPKSYVKGSLLKKWREQNDTQITH